MTPTKIPHLCGGILFGLLYEAKKTRRKTKDKLNGGSDGLTIPGIYAGLINVVTGDDVSSYAGSTLKKCATNYRKCENSTGEYVPFTQLANQSAFDAQYKKKSPDLLERMSRFIDTYLNEAKCEWLVRVLIDTMQAEQLDIEIAINYAENVRASDLHTAKEILFLPFILSVLHYVVMECPDCESGKPTFESWYTQSGSHAMWKLNSNIGNHLEPLNVSVDLAFPADVETVPPKSTNIINTKGGPKVIAENMTKGLQPLIDTLEMTKSLIPTIVQMTKPLLSSTAATKTQEYEIAEKIRHNEQETKTNNQEDLFFTFKNDCDQILQYCINKDPSAEPISISILYQIENLAEKWKFDIRKTTDPGQRKLMQEVVQTLTEYAYYLSDEFLKPVDGSRLIFRNSSFEEGERLRKILRPKSLELRNKMCALYKKLWPAPELDEPEVKSSNNASKDKKADGTVVHQTIVNQYGDHPVHINHVENLKL